MKHVVRLAALCLTLTMAAALSFAPQDAAPSQDIQTLASDTPVLPPPIPPTPPPPEAA